MSVFLKADKISFTYPGEEGQSGVKALDSLSFGIEEGSFTAILGHNGSGKSTLAKILCMINAPTSGSLYVDGKNMSADDVTEEDVFAARRKVGMVFQNPDNQIVATIVEEDVAFGCENLGIEPVEIRKRVDKALADVGMLQYARHPSYNLSGGQKQRVAIAGVIAMRRKCIIFDESTAMLDPMGRREVMAIIEKLNREEGITVILITHHMSEAAMADRIIVMNSGRIIGDGTPSKIFGEPEKMWKAGLDVPQTTELLYKMRAEGLDVALDVFNPDECADAIVRAMIKKQNAKQR